MVVLHSFVMSKFTTEKLEAILVEKLKKAIDPLQRSVDSLITKVSAYEKEIALVKEENALL